MKTLTQTMGHGMPRAKAGDFERAWQVIVAAGGDVKTKAYLAELVKAQADHDKAQAAAEGAQAVSEKREAAAQAAEADATRARQALVDDTAKARDELGKREAGVVAREALATEIEATQDARDKGLAKREDHLRKAGVVLPNG